MLANLGLKNLPEAIADNCCSNLSAPLQNSEHRRLILSSRSGNAARSDALVHVARLSTDEGLVNFNFSSSLAAALTLQRKADALEHKPCGLLANSGRPRNLVTANTILAVRKHPHCEKPLVERDWRIFKNRTDLDRKLCLRMPCLALPHAPRRNKRNILAQLGDEPS